MHNKRNNKRRRARAQHNTKENRKRDKTHSATTQSDSNPSSRRFTPPLLLASQPSLLHAVTGFLLHGFALFATFGGCVNTVHYLSNQFLLGDNPYLTLPVWLAATAICQLIAVGLATAVLASAIQAQRDAMKELNVVWQPDNTISLSKAGSGKLPRVVQYLFNHCIEPTLPLPCELVRGCYSSHWFVVLAVRPVDSKRKRCFPVHLIFARDALSNRSFRNLRLWLKVQR